MRARPESRRAIVGAIVGFAYGSILACLSYLAICAGHGSFLPFFLSSAPVWSLGLLRRLRLLRGTRWRCAGCLDNVWGVGCAVRPREVAQTHPSSGSVALSFGTRADCSDDRARRA